MNGNQPAERDNARRFPLWAVVATVLVLQAILGAMAGIVIDRYAFHRHYRPAYAMHGPMEGGFPQGHRPWDGGRPTHGWPRSRVWHAAAHGGPPER
jgi:hypothetical protein